MLRFLGWVIEEPLHRVPAPVQHKTLTVISFLLCSFFFLFPCVPTRVLQEVEDVLVVPASKIGQESSCTSSDGLTSFAGAFTPRYFPSSRSVLSTTGILSSRSSSDQAPRLHIQSWWRVRKECCGRLIPAPGRRYVI